MHSAVLNTLSLAGAALAVPASLTARQEESCVDKSTEMKLWQVSQFDYHSSVVFTTPAHQNSWGYVNFTLSNPAVDYEPICSASSNQSLYSFNPSNSSTLLAANNLPTLFLTSTSLSTSKSLNV